jgi:hypothetical protein
MNLKTFLFALTAAVLAGQAVAETPTVLQDAFLSARSPEAVQAELIAFKKAGVNPWSGTYDPLKSFASTRSREAVTAEYIAARDEVAAMNAEDGGSAWRAVANHAVVTNVLGAAR